MNDYKLLSRIVMIVIWRNIKSKGMLLLEKNSLVWDCFHRENL